MNDSRRAERVPAKFQVRFRELELDHRMKIPDKAETLDISEGGVFVRTTRSAPVGSLVELSLVLPNRKNPLDIIGKVIWIRDGDEGGMGIEFYKIESTVRDELIRSAKRGQWAPAEDVVIRRKKE